MSRLARTQQGAFTATQLKELGLGRTATKRRVDRGEWVRVRSGVFRLSSAPRGWHQELMAACLWAGPRAVVSHVSAGQLWGLDGLSRGPSKIEVTLPGDSGGKFRGLEVHRTSALTRQDVALRSGIPVTSLSRTLIDLAGCLPALKLELAFEEALRRDASLDGVLRRHAADFGSGRRGVTVLRDLLASRDEQGAADSALESRVFQLLREAGLPRPVLQFNVVERGEWLARVDFAYPHLRMAVEAQGRRYHQGRVAYEKDMQRLSKLAGNGWRTLCFTHACVTRRAGETRRIMRGLYDRLQAELGAKSTGP